MCILTQSLNSSLGESVLLPIFRICVSYEPETQTSSYPFVISTQMSHRHLQLNVAKTESLIFPLKPGSHQPFTSVDGTTIDPVTKARSLRVIFNSSHSFISYIQFISKSCQFSLQNLPHLHLFFSILRTLIYSVEITIMMAFAIACRLVSSVPLLPVQFSFTLQPERSFKNSCCFYA